MHLYILDAFIMLCGCNTILINTLNTTADYATPAGT